MIKVLKFLRAVVATAGALTFVGAVHADLLADIRAVKKIRIALDTGSPPYGFVNASMQPIGSDVETAQLLAKDLGVALEVVNTTSPNRIPFLQTQKADVVVASLSVTPEREKVIDFSKPYAQIQSVVAAPKAMRITGFADLAGKRVATTRGSTNDRLATTGAPDAQMVRYDDDATLVTAAVSGQADVLATAPSLVGAVTQKVPEKNFEIKFVMKTVPLGIGVRKGEQQLVNWINDWIAKNTENGILPAIHKKYHGF
jgi:polar amino acid transport system substrate-binding protein